MKRYNFTGKFDFRTITIIDMHFLWITPCILLLTFIPVCCGALAAQGQDVTDNSLLDSLTNRLNTQELKTNEEISILFQIGLFYNRVGKYDTACFYLKKAIDMPGSRKFESGRLFVNLANSYTFQGQYAQALNYYLEALKIGEELMITGETEGERTLGKMNVIRAMANISEVYYIIGNQNRALYYAEQANEKISEIKMDDRYIHPQILYIIGSVYLVRGMLDKAEENLRKAYEIADDLYRLYTERFGDSRGVVIYKSYGKEGLARIYLARKDYAKALEYAGESLNIARESADPMVLAKAWGVLSDIYQEQGAYAESGESALRAMEVNPFHIELEPILAFNIAVANLFAGNREKAYEFFRTYSNQMKETTDKKFRETMSSMEIQFETEKKQMRISDLEQQQLFYIVLAVSGILLAFTIWAIFWQKMRRAQTKKQLIASHAALEGEQKERERFARDLHDGLGGILSAMKIELSDMESLQNIRDRLDDCIEGLRRIAIGVMPASLLRFGMKAALEDYCRLFSQVRFHFFGEDKRIDDKIELAVYYCAYELVNNSVKHSGATTVNVQLIQDHNRVSLTVQDDGCGFNKKSFVQGVGLKNIADRITAFNGKLDITTSLGNGTETNIELIIKNV
jgi:signal transduction histidine kinase